MRFRVPQFLDIKNKIFGPLTLKQALYLAGGLGLCVIIWFMVPYTFVAIILIIPIAGFSLALAFYTVHERPFIEVVEAAFYYLIGSKLFIWQQREKEPETTDEKAPDENDAEEQPSDIPQISKGRLKELTWSLDVSAGASGADEEEEETKSSGQDTQK